MEEQDFAFVEMIGISFLVESLIFNGFCILFWTTNRLSEQMLQDFNLQRRS